MSASAAAEMFRQPLLFWLRVQYCHWRGRVWFVGRHACLEVCLLLVHAGHVWGELNNVSVGLLRHSHIQIRL